MVARAVVAIVAVVALAWLGVMERNHRLQVRGAELAAPPQAPGDLERAEADFRAARRLNPDRAPDVSRAFVLQAEGRQPEAVALLEDVVAAEPENLGAWRVLLTITRDSDPATGRRALAAVRQLDPLNAPAR